MAEKWQRIHFLLPTFQPLGGMVRDLCFAHHALTLGYEPVICCIHPYNEDLPIFNIPRLSNLSPENGIEFLHPDNVTIGPGDLAFFCGVGMYEGLQHRLSRWTRHEQIIQAVRGIQPTNPFYTDGYALRLLTRPMARIATNDIVLSAVQPYLPKDSLTEVIKVGHDTGFFYKERTGGLGSPIRVAYTAWKSEVGDRTADRLAGSDFEFRAIRDRATWEELRELYQWADVFLSTPLVQEGFYLPGLEAMAAGAIVLTPDVTGNRTYCRFGENCLLVDWEDESSYADVLQRLRSEDNETIAKIRREGYATLEHHSWDREEKEFGAFLDKLKGRLDALGPRLD